METKKKFGLFTSICMIVGIVIGSGIFFKSDNVLIATEGSIFLGVLVFGIAAFAIIFGSLTLAQLAMRTDQPGGIIAYAQDTLGERAALVFGWMQNLVYFPTITAVVSWVVGIYGCILFGIEATLELQILIGMATNVFFYLMNYMSARLAGNFQNFATIAKLLPLFVIAITGILFGDPDFSVLPSSEVFARSTGWLTAIGPVAFSYDGWSIATSLSHEIKDEKKNLPRALVIAPIFILVVYVSYFIGVSKLVGPELIMELGDEHVNTAFNMLLGPLGSKVSLIFVIISIMGTTNGLSLGGSRGLYALGLKGMFPGSSALKKIHPRRDVPTQGLLLSFCLVTFWTFVHYLTTKFNLLPNSDVSEISIVTMYLLYSVLYIQVIRLGLKGEIKGIRKAYIYPICAIIGSLIVFTGGMQNPLFFVYVGVSVAIMGIAYLYAKKRGI